MKPQTKIIVLKANGAATTVTTTQPAGDNSTKLASTAYVDTAVLNGSPAYSPGGYLNSDGATANRGQIQGPFDATNNPRGWVAGAASLTWRGVVTVPSSDPGAVPYFIFAATSSTTAQPANTTNSLFGALTSPNGFLIRQQGGTLYTVVRDFTSSTFRTTYSGQTGILEVYFVQGTTNPVVRWNDVDISASFSLTTSSPPAWLDAAMVPTYHMTGYSCTSGPAPVGCWILGALTDADRAFWRSTGRPPAWVVPGASNAAYKSNTFNNEHAGWGIINSPTITDNVGYVTFGALTANGASNRVQAIGAANLNAPVIVSFEYRKTGGSGNIAFSIGAVPSTDTGNNGTTDWSEVADTSGSFVSRSFLLRNQGTGIQNLIFFGSAVTYDVRNFSLKNQGALSLPVVQPIGVVDDATGIGGNQARLVGVAPVTDKRDWRVCADTFTNGNKQVLEGTLLDSTADVIDSIEQYTTGTPTTTVGSVSAGAQYKASSALAAGINPATLVTRKLATGDVWVNSNSTAQVRTTVKGHRAV